MGRRLHGRRSSGFEGMLWYTKAICTILPGIPSPSFPLIFSTASAIVATWTYVAFFEMILWIYTLFTSAHNPRTKVSFNPACAVPPMLLPLRSYIDKVWGTSGPSTFRDTLKQPITITNLVLHVFIA
ncbi:hypothetical protein BDQ17DRAFT_1380368 [Cyathus striatus]|nr:hypothetical protein BDQ17DRAFT_1380368 [Cyathus striatus]